VRLSRRMRKGLEACAKGLEAAGGRWCAAQGAGGLGGRGWAGWARVGWGGGGEAEERRKRAKREGPRRQRGTRAAEGREGHRQAEGGRGSTRVATYVVGDEHAVEPHRGVAEGAFKVEPEHVAPPLRGDGELLPVPKHVAGEVRLARAPTGAGALRGRARDQTVVWQADLRPVIGSVVQFGLIRSGTGVRVGCRLCVPDGLRVQSGAVSPSEVEA
jgi:hypothetical protein